MTPALSLHAGDWLLIGGYLLLTLVVGILVKGRSESSKESYFLADRSLPWWWAGMSIAATTFAADTPLAVTGIVADRGLSGNWIWLSWIGVHAGVVVYFASRWSRSGVLTDAELVELRYSGRAALGLRTFRAVLYGVVYNAIILGWVLRAMVKIVTPFFHWDVWLPGPLEWLGRIWPADSALGSPSEGLTIVALLAVVGTYSTLGGIRGVILTDLLQLGMALLGSVWLALAAWDAVGGGDALRAGLGRLYGADHAYLDLFPSLGSGWLAAAGLGAFTFGAYLLVQSYANVPADGGGYLMQRLNTTRTPNESRRAALLFLVLQYVVRTVPWFVVAVAALVLVPLGAESQALGGAGAAVGADRELAYPVLMGHLLPPVALGLLVTSLLAAFMSTVDTHLNWGASYVVNDLYLRLRPGASARRQVRVARLAVAGFAALAVLVSFRIDSIEQAWKWVAALGAALGVPTALRWLWWRVNAAGELGAMATGLGTALGLSFTDLPYEVSLVLTSGASVVGLGAGMLLGRPTDPERLRRFVERVQPRGFWPGRRPTTAWRELGGVALRWAAVVAGSVGLMAAVHRIVFLGQAWIALALAAGGTPLLWWGARRGRGD
ncbi:MAG: Na+:solute symporter [Deltaproteobacteria bacterium]|nr:Na+:solute symporter [Deltaproteobacteria bacterium]